MAGLIPRFCPHCNGPLDVPRIVTWGGWTYDEEKRTLEPDGSKVQLTLLEGGLLGALLRANGRPVAKTGGLYATICNDKPEIDWPDIKIVDIHISKLRRKLFAVYGRNVLVSTQWGVGYYATPVGEIPLVPNITGRHMGGRPRVK